MKKNMKLKITALAAMLFMAVAVTFLSFSHADEDLTEDALIVADGEEAIDVGSKTNIDYIIMNSKTTDSSIDPYYNIVEIYSDTPSSLKDFAEKGGFEKNVVNGYSTVDEIDPLTNAVAKAKMAEKKVNYVSYKVSSITNDDEATLKAISNADLIYINQGKKKFSISNDICEELYNILHTYAVGDYKPLIINSQGSSGGSGDDSSKQTLAQLTKEVFSSGIYYYTFGWNTTKQTVEQFLGHTNGSMYLGINGTKQQSKGKWTTIEKTDTAGEEETVLTKDVARFLVVSSTGASTSTTMLPYLIPSTLTKFDKTGYHLVGKTEDYANPDGSVLYDIKAAPNVVVSSVYNAKYKTPDVIQVEQCKLDDLISDTYDLSKYDFILLDESISGATEVTKEFYNKLAGAMYGSVSMVYNSALGDSTISTNTTTITDFSSYNYLELYYMVASTDNVSRYDNVLVTTQSKFEIMTAGNVAGAGGIADLINKSTYRGIGGKGSSSNMYTVLEIQPCYPIDLSVANDSTHNGSYYTIPANVLNDVDKDKLPRDNNGNIKVEYYDWELSKAKIAEAIGVDPGKINLVHMSTEELAASKEPLLGTYDLIYIGGNTTALKDAGSWRSVSGLLNYAGGVGSHVSTENLRYLPIYTMYCHNGDMAAVSVDSLGYSGGDVKGGSPMASVNINGTYYDGKDGAKGSFSLLNGNDISYDRLNELNAYVDAGMPVIVEATVSNAYEEMINMASDPSVAEQIVKSTWNRMSYSDRDNLAQTIGMAAWQIQQETDAGNYTHVYQLIGDPTESLNMESLQNSIDPDCNMRKFLDNCYAHKTADGATSSATKTVLWGLSNTSSDASFANYTAVKTLVKSSNQRPKLVVTSMPLTYNYYDPDTRLSTGELNFVFEVEGSNDYTVELLIDDDCDNVYEKSMDADVTENTLKCTLADSFFGPVSWMLQVKDKSSELTAYVKGISYIKNSNGKQTVKVLQIMPGKATLDEDGKLVAASNGKQASEGAQGSNALYFCPICQNVYERLEYNPIVNTSSHFSMWYDGTGAYFECTKDKTSSQYLGKHEHIFGIPKYDSNLSSDGYTGIDDWSTNLADDVSDLYDFDLDIMLRSEFEDVSQGIHDAYTADDATMNAKISSFTIGTTDPDYALYQSLTTAKDKYTFILKREYAAAAKEAYDNYVDAKSDTESTVEALENAMDVVIANNTYGFAADFKTVKKTGRYSDVFNAIGTSGSFKDQHSGSSDTQAVADAFYKYRDKKDIEITYHDEYKRLNRYAYPENWLKGCYDMVIIGPSDDFNGDDITNAWAIADLKQYVKDNGSVLLFHDTLTPARDNGSSNLTKNLREYFGMDRNRGLSVSSTAGTNTYYMPYDSSDENRYYMTNLSYKKSDDNTRYGTWVDDIKMPFSNFTGTKYLTDVVYTDSFVVSDYGKNPGATPYRYANQHWQTATFWYRDAKNNAKDNTHYGTDKASQNNKGIITQYPFTLSDSLNISGTHAQAYALELDSSKMTVWYSLAGGNNTKQDKDETSASSMYAASRNDGMDNYFIYSYGNVNYCGAGHSKVTGLGKDNNDERRLYINIIVNSVKPSVNQPSITVYDYKTKNKKTKEGKNYIMEVKDTDAWPEFSFNVAVDTSDATNKLERVRIFYDLDYSDTNTSNKFDDDVNHIMIADMSKDLDTKTIYDVGKDLTNLQLKPKYFDPYNQEYTYIVIWATDSKGNDTYSRIKIKLLPHLFDMT